MTLQLIYITTLILFLFFLNFFLEKFNLLIHSRFKEEHKKFGQDKIPLSGGVFFFVILSFLIINESFLSLTLIYSLFAYLLLGLIVDYEIHINPKTRLIVQIFLTIGLVLLNDLLISKTNLFFLDDFLKNFYFNIFFTSLCILIILNGLNFMDGVNNNVIGFCLLLLISIYIIEYKNASFENLHFYNLFLLSLVIFYLFNSFNKNYLGDSGIYILSIFISVLVISFINNSPYVSPILAVNFLWYPAFETLFSIIRKLFVKKNPFKPDTGHLHTLILKYFGLKRFEFKNTTTGICINLALIPNFYIAINYHNNSKILFFTSVVYLIIYVMFYFRLNSFLKKK